MIDIAKLEDLPKFIGIRKERKSKNDYYRHYYRNGNHPWKIIKRIFKHFIGRSFDDAFSYYCTKVPKNLQHYFPEEVEKIGRNYHRYNQFIIDDNKIIRENPEYNSWRRTKRKLTARSSDYKTAWKHRNSGEISDKAPQWYWQREYWDVVVISGEELEFSSKKDPLYQSWKQREIRAQIKANRYRKKLQKSEEYCFLTDAEKQLKLQKEKRMTTNLTYVAAPYSKFENKQLLMLFVTGYSAKLFLSGVNVVCPLTMGHHFSSQEKELATKDTEWWLKWCYSLLYNCKQMHVLTLEGWERSVGVQAEIAFAKENKIPIKYVKP